MKRYLIPTVAVLTVMAVTWSAFAQDEETPAQRVQRERRAQAERVRQRFENMSEAEREEFLAEMRKRRERFRNMSEAEREKFRAEMRERFGGRLGLRRDEQLTVIKAIEQQVSKLKAAVQSIGPENRSRIRELSEEQRNNLRERMAKANRERMAAIRAIQQQLAKLQGPRRQPQTGRQPSVGDLKVIHALALKEKATQTAQSLEKLIARYQREPGTRREPRLRPERLDRPPRERPGRQRRDVEAEMSGKAAPDFELNTFDGKTISLSDYRGKTVVLEWMNFECPFSRYHYQTKKTMVDLAKKYRDKNVVWLVINSTSHTTPEANKAFAEKYGLQSPILDDRSGTVGRAYGAVTTPHMYIINTGGRIVYEGAIDDSPLGQKKEGVVNYVDKALAELTAGKEVSTPKTKPYGCTVKYAK